MDTNEADYSDDYLEKQEAVRTGVTMVDSRVVQMVLRMAGEWVAQMVEHSVVIEVATMVEM